ncbi:MAG: GNAT family N-acetyltransferase [Candidatus Dormibacteria bacterium]
MFLRIAIEGDRPFITEMARLASSLEGLHPVPQAEDPAVIAVLPSSLDLAVLAVNDDQHLVGAAWCHWHTPTLLFDDGGEPFPEVVMAVRPEVRGQGVGAALLAAVADAARAQATMLSLNVHLLNPAVRLYIRNGFRVAGKGRGWYGVAMSKVLSDEP